MRPALSPPVSSETDSSPLSPTNELENDQQDENKQTFTLCKLLNSHSSVFNALNNPELDVPTLDSPEIHTPDIFPDQHQSQFSITSWQSIANDFLQTSPAISRVSSNMKRVAKTSSILSTDDDLAKDYSIIVPTPSNPNPMVFDSDEEGDSEYEIPQRSFIMPKMSFSATSSPSHNKYQVVILSFSHKPEIDQLIGSLRDELTKQINIIHINLQSEWSNTKSIMQSSNLIFIINDGSSTIVNYLNSIKPVEEDSQKVTIVNLITVNYFINLFDLINSLRPYQIWKAASLKHDNVIDRFTSFIELECDAEVEDNSKQIVPKAMYYSSLISTQKPDYKVIEKQFKLDLKSSTNFNDPFKLSKSFTEFDFVYTNFKKFFDDRENNMLLICSFTLGIGFGIGMATGTISLLGNYIYNEICGQIPPQSILSETTKSDFESGSTADKMIEALSNASIVLEVKEFCTNYVLGFSSTVIVWIQDGLEKVIGLFLYL